MMSTRNYGLIRRNLWYKNDAERNAKGFYIESDFDTFHSRLPSIFSAQIDRPGIIHGLEIISDKSNSIIQIKTGVAINDKAQMVVLASIDGYALVGKQKEEIKVKSGSISINLEKFPNRKLALTIEHTERDFAEDTGSTIFKKDLIPWVQLLEPESVASGQIVLAYIETADEGIVEQLSHTDGTNQRQVITHALGGINIMCPQTNGGEVSQVIAGEIRPAKDGKGIEIDCILRVRDIVFIDDSPE